MDKVLGTAHNHPDDPPHGRGSGPGSDRDSADDGWTPRPAYWLDDIATSYGHGPAVVLLDQTRLPAEEVRLVCSDVPTLVDAVRRLVVRGAPVLGIVGAYGVALAAARGEDVKAAAEDIAHARPTAVNLAWGARRALAVWEASGGDAAAVLSEARVIHEDDAQASEAMAAHGARFAGGLEAARRRMNVLTHCNTGALVSGGAGTALAVVRDLHRAGRLGRLWVDETRPLLQGARLTAYEAARMGLPYAVLPDSAAGSLFAAGEVDLVVVGADRIAADGATANKVGTYPLAVLARHHGVPFVVVAPMSTIDPATPDGGAIVVEQRDAGEVTELSGVPLAPAGSAAYNPAFDVTPPELITAIVTESGVLSPVSTITIARMSAGHDPVMRR